MPLATDDLGRAVNLPREATRVVSLVPSLTEALASARAGALVGATQFCTHPAGLNVARVRGTKNPDIAAIAALRPDVVVANQEENRALDAQRLEAAGVPVWVTRIDSLDDAFASLRRLFSGLGWDEPGWVAQASDEWAEQAPTRVNAAAFIWRDPWMAIGQETFASDVLARLGVSNAVSEPRYPRVDPHDVDADLTLLTTEPYAFGSDDTKTRVGGRETRLVDGRLLEWYGPSLLGARAALTEQILG